MPPRRRRLWQQNSPIASYSGSSDDESLGNHSDADESDYYGSVGSNFMPISLKPEQNTNITDVPSPVDEDTIIEPVDSPQQKDTVTESIERPQLEDTIIKPEGPLEEDPIIKSKSPEHEDSIIESIESPQHEETITESIERPQYEDTIIEPIKSLQQEDAIIKSENPHEEVSIIKSESPEPSATLKSLQISATDISPEQSVSPSPFHPIKSESQIDEIIMADSALLPKAEQLSDASSKTLGRSIPILTPSASSEAPSSDDEVTDRCYGFLLLNYPKALPAAIDTISVLLIYQRRLHGLHPYWGFPKGHPEPEDRSDWESASRELLEETGLSPERVKPITPSGFLPPLPDSVAGLRPDFMSIVSQYPTLDGGIKEVTYFLARVAELEKLTEQVEELVECRWVKLSEARQLVDTKPVQRVLEKLIGLVLGSKETFARSDWIRWKDVDALDGNGMARQWRTVGFCTPE
ncbi:hypothetical protein V493_01612 [Pseudogymnoascus sp. VKM F-4281 (FW-2241)]|nr:hypothetical protein V493_01612 [Pseudogymnoascus sp. VKM F-4281 (FW-2241)]